MVPDGVLAPWLWILGWVAAAAGLAAALWATRDSDRARLVPLAAVLAGVMTLVMSLEIAPLAYEPHLTALAGIVLGPAYGFLAVFVFNVLRMLLGDGAVTLLGLNTLILGLEAVLAYCVFRAVARAVARPLTARGPLGAGIAAAVAAWAALALATLVFLGAVALGASDLAEVGEEVLDRLGGGEPAFSAYAGIVLTLGAIGWVIESLLVGAIVGFLRAVRPVLVPMPSAALDTSAIDVATTPRDARIV